MAALEMVLRGPCKGVAVIADEASAQAVIVDLDAADAEAAWGYHREKYPDRPAILLSLNEPGIEGALFLKKPVQIGSLVKALGQARADLSSAMVTTAAVASDGPVAPVAGELERRDASLAVEGSAASRDQTYEIDPDDPAFQAKYFFLPADYTGHHIVEAVKQAVTQGKSLMVRCPAGALVVLPTRSEVVTGCSGAALKKIVTAAYRKESLEFKLSAAEPDIGKIVEKFGGAAEIKPLEVCLWEMGAWLSSGRVPHGMSLVEPVVLYRWPNLTRLLLTPNAMRIAALWTDRPFSLLDTAKGLRIPLGDVLTFYSAAIASGLGTACNRKVDRLFRSEVHPGHANRSLMQRILSKLRGDD